MTFLEVFTLIGSILGIISFILNLTIPFSDYNKEKLEVLKNIIRIEDIKIYENEINSGFLTQKSNDKLFLLIDCIRCNSEEVQFKGPWGQSAKKDLKKIYTIYYEMVTKLQVPYWTTSDRESLRFVIDKEYYYNRAKSQQEYDDCEKTIYRDISFIIGKLNQIHSLYKSVYRKLDKLPAEYFFLLRR